MEVQTHAVSSQDQPRFSRYRSVRKAASRDDIAIPTAEVPPLPRQTSQQDIKAQAAPSRYRRTTNSRQNGPESQALQPLNHNQIKQNRPEPILEVPLSQPEKVHVSVPEQRQRDQSCDRKATEPPKASANRGGRYRSRTVTKPAEKVQSNRRSYDQAREEARLILEGEYDRLERLKKQQHAAELERKKRAELKLAAQKAAEAEEARLQELARLEVERQRQLEDQQKAEQKQEQRAQRTRKWTIGGSSGHKSPPGSAPQSPPNMVQHVRSNTTRSPSQDRQRKASESEPKVPAVGDSDRPSVRQRIRRPTISKVKDAPKAFEPKVGDGPPKTAVNGPAATVDAPISAVNAGERRVEVRCEKSKITLPVTPTTTVRDLLNSASIIMSQNIDPRSDVLIETYAPLGLERPLRRYEHIRDIMNSWDSDTQNYLMIMPPSEISAIGLEQKEAPPDQPPKTIVQIHHSQKPGKWEKHWMTMKSDGQVTASSKENDIDATNVFHISDFDVYMPTKKQLKKLHPPKKICLAIKSQQRSIVFESTENFVHFFTTNDKQVADAWYNAIQTWRSWYLVDVLGQGVAPVPVESTPLPLGLPRPSTSNHRDSIPYQLGTFQPLLDFSADAFSYGEHEQKTEVRRSQTLVGHVRNKPSEARVDRSRTLKHNTNPHQSIHHSNPHHSTHHPNLHHPHPSISHTPAPVPSSTDAAFTGKGLLARAFSVRKAKAEENQAFLQDTDNAFTGSGLIARTRSVRKAPENPAPIPLDSEEAFTGGLLARTRSVRKQPEEFVAEDTSLAFTGGLLGVQRGVTKKRSLHRGPLVDLHGNSTFQDGSLLRQVEGYEAANGLGGPVIDRSKGVEVGVRTGEA